MAKPLLPKPDPVIEAYKKDVDRTLLRENLRLTAQQHFENLMQLQRFAASCERQAGRQGRTKDRRASSSDELPTCPD